MSRPFSHVFACLVHDNQSCVRDLVANLSAFDSSSRILLYNGGDDHQLLEDSMFRTAQVLVHPSPVRMRWGFLHEFALGAFEYLEHLGGFDALTIVDSDQLCLRPGYAEFLASFLRAQSDVGMLGTVSDDEPMTMPSAPALSAFSELGLWKPFLQRLPQGMQTFPLWTFWPSTVFTSRAAKALLALFRGDPELQQILARSGIWATEEVLLPSLTAALGFRVLRSPCDRTFVRFRTKFDAEDVQRALDRPLAYWMHPVAREFSDPLRAHIRMRCAASQTDAV